MRMINIRDLRGPIIEELSGSDQLAGITNNRVLSAIMVPVGEGWVGHLVEANWSRIYQNVVEGTYERKTEVPLATIDEVVSERSGEASPAQEPESGSSMDFAESLANVWGIARSFLRLHEGGADVAYANPPAMRTVRIGDLSGALLTEAGEAKELIALTNGRKLVAFLIPVTTDLIIHLVENNLTRVMFSVTRGEQARQSGHPFETLDDVVDTDPPDGSPRSYPTPSADSTVSGTRKRSQRRRKSSF